LAQFFFFSFSSPFNHQTSEPDPDGNQKVHCLADGFLLPS
jgi:hypothetical protein